MSIRPGYHRHINLPEVAYGTLLGGFVLSIWLVMLLMPKMSDDYWYSFHLHDFLEGVTGGFPWQAIKATWAEHYQTDNLRLPNLLLPLLLIAPKWLAAAIPAIAAGAMVHLIILISHRDAGHPCALALVIAMVTFLLPWHELMFTLCYSMNYVVTSAVTLLQIHAWINADRRRATPTGVVSGLLLGCMHEGFALPLLIAQPIALAAMGRGWRSPAGRRRIIMTAALIPGSIFLLTSPGLYANLDINRSGLSIHNILRVIKLHLPLLAYMAVLTVKAIRGRSWRIIIRPLPIIIIVASAVAIYIHISYARGYRTGWLAYLLGITGLISAVTQMPAPRKCRKPLKVAAAIALATLTGAHFATVIRYAHRMKAAHAEITAGYMQDPSAPVYADLMPIERMSLLAWRQPLSNGWNEWARYNFTAYHSRSRYREQPTVVTVPDVVREISPAEGRPVPGAARAREIGGYYFARIKPERYGVVLPVRLGRLSKRMYFDCMPFRDINGDEWVWLMPQSSFFPTFLMTMTEIDLWENDSMEMGTIYYDGL